MTMKTTKQIAVAGVASFLLAFALAPRQFAAQPAAPITPSGHIELFNGKDFTGWTFCLRTNAEPSKTYMVTSTGS
jgi:hypothetical protein